MNGRWALRMAVPAKFHTVESPPMFYSFLKCCPRKPVAELRALGRITALMALLNGSEVALRVLAEIESARVMAVFVVVGLILQRIDIDHGARVWQQFG